MIRRLPAILLVLLFCATPNLFSLQAGDPQFDRAFEAGKQAVEKQDYANAIGHFNHANEVRQGKCSECYLWIARIQMADDKLQEALANNEKSLATAASDQGRARAQLYRGLILSRQGDLPLAELAFKAASTANPACIECRFNLGFILLKQSKDTEGVAVLKSIASDFAGTSRGREIQRFIDDPSRIRKHYAPEFTAQARNGDEVSLDVLKGKVVLLDFWGTWCAPCRASLPRVRELAAQLDPAKVAIISIDEGDPKPKWEQFVQENGMNWQQVYDADRSLYRAFNVDGFPRYYLLSKDGIILAEFKGWAQTGESAISNAIREALKQ